MLTEAVKTTQLGGVPAGMDAMVFAETAAQQPDVSHIFVARDQTRLRQFRHALAFFAPTIITTDLLPWDCLPYDRVGPSPEVAARRTASLSALASSSKPNVVITTVAAILQRLPPPSIMRDAQRSYTPDQDVDFDDLERWLQANGYQKSSMVVSAGEYAVRGGIFDVFPPGAQQPVRLDCFGDTLESLRTFDPITQRTTGSLKGLTLNAASELMLFPDAISNFRSRWLKRFGVTPDDATYEAISAGQRHQGAEHLLPLFYDDLVPLTAYLGDNVRMTLDEQVMDAATERLELIADYHNARLTAHAKPADFHGLNPSELYLDDAEWQGMIGNTPTTQFSPLVAPDARDVGGRTGHNFAAARASETADVFTNVAQHIEGKVKDKKRVILAASSEGASERLGLMLTDHGVPAVLRADDWPAVKDIPDNIPTRVVLPLDHGFETHDLAVISETDILGERLGRKGGKRRRANNFINEVSSLSAGDLIVHIDHGVGRYLGLRTMNVVGASHDCLELIYADDAKLYLPVENIDLLSRYGAEGDGVRLDKLGGASWQNRKAKAKKRLKDMAAGLIKIAAARAMKTTEPIDVARSEYDEFCARFPYEETDDQLSSIADVMEDLSKPTPMDRLICGDVGFGKTEVALRAAFAATLAGKQVAVVCPTTLLARQHFRTFQDRFKGWPVEVRQLSRLVPGKQATETRNGLKDGTVDIVIGTHAVLSERIEFDRLGLMIIDEEQHFGVKHKERLKSFRADVHVLTLTATPIPRTLQLSLSGIREMSIIATPPVDRLVVRTYTAKFDAAMAREALLREKYRGGQSFMVVPRIADLGFLEEFLRSQVPEVKFMTAHGQMAAGQLEDIMSAFVDGQFDVLLSTTIVESGLDIPSANTLLIYKAENFGLAQLYQLRGRVGRSKQRAYAYMLNNPKKPLTQGAEQRLKVLQSLDSLGAGFQLASHDLDIRGGGNLLGEEQSGHIKEVGVELYQQMLEDAVAELKSGGPVSDDNSWSPQIKLGLSVMIPEAYVPDLNVRLSLYRRLSDAQDVQDREALAAELIDRFGPMPPETQSLLAVMGLKAQCRTANVEKIDAGPKGAVITFRNNDFPNPAALIAHVAQHPQMYKVRPDMSLLIKGVWPRPDMRLKTLSRVMGELVDMVG